MKLGQAPQALRAFAQFRVGVEKLSKEEETKVREKEQQARELEAQMARPATPERPLVAVPTSAEQPPVRSAATATVTPSAAAATPPAQPPITPVTVPKSTPARWSSGRLAAIGMLGGLLVVSLATSIALTALNGKLTQDECQFGTQMFTDCAYNLTPAYGVGYGVSGLLAGGLVLALTLPVKAPAK